MTARRTLTLIWIAAGIALLLPRLRETPFFAPPPERFAANVAEWTDGGFAPDGFYPFMTRAGLPAGLRTAGSWQGGDEWQGDTATPWIGVGARAMRVLVAGYPQQAGIALAADWRFADGRVESVRCPVPNAGETWSAWDVGPPPGAVEVRLRADDRAASRLGWIAFSEPFAPASETPRAWLMAAEVIGTVALALAVVWGPGLLWAAARLAPEIRLVMLLGTGPLVLAAGGLLIWRVGSTGSASTIAVVYVAFVWMATGVALWRRGALMSRGMGVALAASALVVAATAAKASVAGGPEGELYAGRISRTLAVGDRSDARISYHVVQVVAHGLSPAEPAAERYFAPWTFFSRGPLAGLAAAPIALAMGGATPEGKPDHPWMPFDAEGFAAYRITLMVLASGAAIALFGAVAMFAGERWGAVAAGILALSPFGVHEVLYTWPKLEAAAWVIASFVLAHVRRPALSGLALGVGFLYHPLALLWAPWICLWSAGRCRPDGIAGALRAGAATAAAIAAIAAAWMIGGALAPHSPNAPYGQTSFLEYFSRADGVPAVWSTWWYARWMNVSNTFLPFWLYTFHPDSPWVTSVDGRSGSLVRFAFGWWNTLPLGLGLLTFVLSIAALARAVRTHVSALLLLVVLPALLLIVYWGSYAAGLMRECGHPLFAAWIGVACVALARAPGRLASVFAHPIFPWLRLPEILLMLWLTTFANPARARADLDPFYLTMSTIALCGAAWVLSRGAAAPAGGRLADDTLTPQS